MNNPIRVIIADDHALLRKGFKTILQDSNEISIIAEAESGKELLELVHKYHPDVVVVDVRMPSLDGIQACALIKERVPNIAVIGLSVYDDPQHVHDMIAAGAKGYMLKNASSEDLVTGIMNVHQGNMYFSKGVEFLETAQAAEGAMAYNTGLFSSRELHIIELTSRQFTNKEIAGMLNISTRTVEGYKERMQKRISAKNMIGVLVYASVHQLIRLRFD